MGTSGNRACQWASRSALKDFTEDALTISAGSLFQNCTASRLVDLVGVPRSPLRVGCAKVDAMGNSKRPWVILNMAIRCSRILRA